MKLLSQCLFLVSFGSTTEAWVSSPNQKSHSLTSKRRGSSTTSLSMGITSTVRRVRDSILSRERTREDLKIGIAGFYDRSSKLWEDVWGEVSTQENPFVTYWSWQGYSTTSILSLIKRAWLAHAPRILRSRKPYRSRPSSSRFDWRSVEMGGCGQS